jgi:hypothetical protein
MMSQGNRVPFIYIAPHLGYKGKKRIYEKSCPGQLQARLRPHAVVFDRIGYLFKREKHAETRKTHNKLMAAIEAIRSGAIHGHPMAYRQNSICEFSYNHRTFSFNIATYHHFGPIRNGPMQFPTTGCGAKQSFFDNRNRAMHAW